MYKVVYSDVGTNNLYSVIGSYQTGASSKAVQDFCIQYKINEWTYPKVNGTNLMCFSKLSSAKDFAISPGKRFRYKIFKCATKGARKKGFFVTAWDLDTLLAKELYKQKKMRKKITCENYRECYYPNTVFCSAIKLLHEV